MKELSFRDYVLTHSPENSPAGDFIMDAKQMSDLPDAKSWKEVKLWLESHSACSAAIDCANMVWKRFQRARQPIPVDLGVGITVASLIDFLKKEDPAAHVVAYRKSGKTVASRVLGFSRVNIKSGSTEQLTHAVMLEG